MCRKSFVMVFCFLCLSLSLSAQELSSPVPASVELGPSVSERLRLLAQRLRELSTGSLSDLDQLDSERHMLLSALQEIQTQASASEADLALSKSSITDLLLLLTNSQEQEQKERHAKQAWRSVAIVSAVVTVLVTVYDVMFWQHFFSM